jgi:hypothetical protein
MVFFFSHVSYFSTLAMVSFLFQSVLDLTLVLANVVSPDSSSPPEGACGFLQFASQAEIESLEKRVQSSSIDSVRSLGSKKKFFQFPKPTFFSPTETNHPSILSKSTAELFQEHMLQIKKQIDTQGDAFVLDLRHGIDWIDEPSISTMYIRFYFLTVILSLTFILGKLVLSIFDSYNLLW